MSNQTAGFDCPTDDKAAPPFYEAPDGWRQQEQEPPEHQQQEPAIILADEALDRDTTPGPGTNLVPEDEDDVADITSDVFWSTAPDHGNANLQVDSASSNGDSDSTLGEDIPGSTISLRESVYRYHRENGRRYHSFNAGKYVLPNDEEEQERLDLQHHLYMLTFEALHLAPLPKSLNYVLDIGTGTGLWAIEFAQKYPMAIVLGTDLSPIQPEYVPPNCMFQLSDAEEPWTYSQKFDYIHGRTLLACFRDPAQIITEAYNALAPGGVLEMQDPQLPIACIDDTIDGRPLRRWSNELVRAAAILGRPVTNSQHYGHWMAEAGFVDIVERHFYWPLNSWPRGKREKLLGLWAQQNITDGLQAMSLAVLTRGLGWSRAEIEFLLAGVRADLKNRAVHAYIDVVVFYGRKPHPGEVGDG